MFITQLIIGCLMVSLTVLIHAIALDKLVIFIETLAPKTYSIFQQSWKAPLMVITVLCVFLAHVLQIWLWALIYLYIEPHVINNIETALYYSGGSFTTLGISDIILDKNWRLLSSFEAANGFILFGWSTAFIFEIISKLYKDEHIRKK